MATSLTFPKGAKFACIGAGLVGSAWAVVFAKAGFTVALYDQAPAALPAAKARMEQICQTLFEGGFMTEPPATVMARMSYHAALAPALKDALYVQESASEVLDLKQALFAELAELCGPDTILASSTSALRGSQFMDIPHPERALVVHPVNPPAFIPLVELCSSGQTAPETMVAVKTLMQDLGMSPVILRKEIDGFLLNRLQFTLVAEALHLVGEGYCTPEDIDLVLTQGLALRWAALGPFEVAHLNAPDGFQGFIDRLGPMMRHLGQQAQTDYDWPEDLAATIHARMVQHIPLPDLPKRAQRRDRAILATRKMQENL